MKQRRNRFLAGVMAMALLINNMSTLAYAVDEVVTPPPETVETGPSAEELAALAAAEEAARQAAEQAAAEEAARQAAEQAAAEEAARQAAEQAAAEEAARQAAEQAAAEEAARQAAEQAAAEEAARQAAEQAAAEEAARQAAEQAAAEEAARQAAEQAAAEEAARQAAEQAEKEAEEVATSSNAGTEPGIDESLNETAPKRTFTVTYARTYFDTDGNKVIGIGQTSAPVVFEEGAPLIPPKEDLIPLLDGYIADAYWYSDPAMTQKVDFAAATASANITLYTKATAPEPEPAEETEKEPEAEPVQSAAPKPATMQAPEQGAPIAGVPQEEPGIMPIAEQAGYTAIFHSNHGTDITKEIASPTNDIKGPPPECPSEFEYPGYEFKFWSKYKNGQNSEVDASGNLTYEWTNAGKISNLHYYAIWEKIVTEHTVTYVVKGDKPEEYTAPEKQTYNSDQNYTVAPVPVASDYCTYYDGDAKKQLKDEYTFDGWYDAETGGKIVSGEQPMGDADVTLYGFWTKTEHPRSEYQATVTYQKGDSWPSSAALPAGSPFTVDKGSTHTVAGGYSPVTEETDDSVNEYTFDGWYLNNKKVEGAIEVTGNIKLVGKWNKEVTPKYTITVTVENGTAAVDGKSGSTFKAVEGEKLTVRFAPASGEYALQSAQVNGEDITLTDGAYTFEVTGNTTISVVYVSLPDPSVDVLRKFLKDNGIKVNDTGAGNHGTETYVLQPGTYEITNKHWESRDKQIHATWTIHFEKYIEQYNEKHGEHESISADSVTFDLKHEALEGVAAYDGWSIRYNDADNYGQMTVDATADIQCADVDYTVAYYYDESGNGHYENGSAPEGAPDKGTGAVGTTIDSIEGLPEKLAVSGLNYVLDHIESSPLQSGAENVVRVYYKHYVQQISVRIKGRHIEWTYDGTQHVYNHSADYPLFEIINLDEIPKAAGLSVTLVGYKQHVIGKDVKQESLFNDPSNFIVNLQDPKNYSYVVILDDPGSLTIKPRTVTITSAGDSKEYDGTPLTSHDYTVTEYNAETGEGFVDGEGFASVTVTGSQTVVGSSANAFDYTLNEGTKAINYTITKKEGTLEVTDRTNKYEITVEANSDTVTYNGTGQSVSGFKTQEFEVNGQKYTVSGLSASASGKDANEYPANVTGIAVVKDAAGNDVTAQFTVKSEDGKLTINKRTATVKSASADKEYDGAELTAPEVTGEGFVAGEGVTGTATGSQTIVGSSKNAFTYEANVGTNLDNYEITKTEGTLTVSVRTGVNRYPITITANSGSAGYDGNAHRVDGYTMTTTTFNGFTYTVSGIAASSNDQYNAGVYPVTFTGEPVVTDAAGNDVSDNFSVTLINGTLTITAPGAPELEESAPAAVAPVVPGPGGTTPPAGPAAPAGLAGAAGAAAPGAVIPDDDTPLAGGPDAGDGDDGDAAGGMVIDDDDTPLAGGPADGTAIEEGETPLGLLDDVVENCCILHLLIMLAALAVAVYYTHNRKKHQQKQFDMRRELGIA